ncbi:MAG TPA: N-acetyl-gamma-glutamyl-phosphate reductase [Bacteroidota bacterium]|jgi:N-acetyl-gamma-glutamyl-phosphate reductase|nr:N-acetyl-gamma-glutamyl-phosphate reductase [Bacteroidota bacterium]
MLTSKKIRAAIIGASGYSGAELLRLLSTRDDVEITRVVAGTSAGKKVAELYPVFAGTVDLQYEEFRAEKSENADIAFVALPSGESMKVVPGLLASVGRVIDLGGDFRLLSPELYTQYYKHEHVAQHLLSEAVYGLPELNSQAIADAKLIANPGCYPTSVILALLPALKSGLIKTEHIVVNSLSGVSGAGRSASVELSFTEVNENIKAYKIGNHQHIPEIQTVLEKASGSTISLSFVPHLVPITRGIYTTIHASLDAAVTEAEIRHLYEAFYREAPFVRIRKEIPQIKDVARTNFCDIGMTLLTPTKQIVLTSVIDNLVKGAAGQAVQNMNIMFGLKQTKGLL